MTYTPSTEEVAEAYWAVSGEPSRDSEASQEFYRWLAEYTRQQREEAWDEALKYVNDLSDPAYTINIFPDRELITLGDVYQAQDENPYRSES